MLKNGAPENQPPQSLTAAAIRRRACLPPGQFRIMAGALTGGAEALLDAAPAAAVRVRAGHDMGALLAAGPDRIGAFMVSVWRLAECYDLAGCFAAAGVGADGLLRQCPEYRQRRPAVYAELERARRLAGLSAAVPLHFLVTLFMPAVVFFPRQRGRLALAFAVEEAARYPLPACRYSVAEEVLQRALRLHYCGAAGPEPCPACAAGKRQRKKQVAAKRNLKKRRAAERLAQQQAQARAAAAARMANLIEGRIEIPRGRGGKGGRLRRV